jgi:hypothetical protein
MTASEASRQATNVNGAREGTNHVKYILPHIEDAASKGLYYIKLADNIMTEATQKSLKSLGYEIEEELEMHGEDNYWSPKPRRGRGYRKTGYWTITW